MIWVALLVLIAYVTVPRLPTKRRIRRAHTKREPRQRRRKRDVDLGAVVTEVATRLRSGAAPDHAWRQALQAAGISVGDTVLDERGIPLALWELWRNPRQRRTVGLTEIGTHTLPATFAVCQMSYRTGAPMADVLESCAAGITESGEALSAREVALAGPRSSAHMLALLPAVGLMLGYAFGAEPLTFLLTTPTGRMVGCAGLICEAVGAVWVHVMVARARDVENE